MKRILCLRFPNWPILRRSVKARADQGSAAFDVPMVLYETVRMSRRVKACSAGARVMGVVVGMPMTEAMSLLGAREGRKADLCIEEDNPAADRESLEGWAQWCRRYSPSVGVEDTQRPDCIFLDITGLTHLLGDESTLAEKIVKQFTHQRLPVRIAVADTLGAAWAVAHDSQKVGISIVPPSEIEAVLGPLPVETLRLPEKIVGLLRQLGVYQIEQLGVLPRDGLNARFGPELLTRWDQATGRLPEPFPAIPLPEDFRAEQLLEHPTKRRDTLEFLLEQLTGRVAEQLRGAGRQAVRLECFLIEQAGARVDLSVGLFQATASASHLSGLLKMRLERAAPRRPVERVCVEATITARCETRQTNLFSDEASLTQSAELAGLLDRLSGRLGARAVARVKLGREALPELAYQYRPAVEGRGARRTRARSTKSNEAELPPRPIRLFEKPMRLGSRKVAAGFPDRFGYRGREYHVARHWGPERIETGWWRGETIARDYYRVETACGARFWVFRNLRDNGWFLHGVL